MMEEKMADELRRDDRRFYKRRGFAAFKRISWGAVFAGLVVALVLQLILTLLGLGIGMGTIDLFEESNPVSGLGTGALIWWFISVLISLFSGGWVAGRLAGMPRTADSILHGVLTFSLYSIVTFYLITTTVGSIISGVGGILGKTFSLAGEGIAAVSGTATEQVKQQDVNSLKQEIYEMLGQTGEPGLSKDTLEKRIARAREDVQSSARDIATNPQQAGEEIDSLINRLFSRANKVITAADREDLVNVLVARTDMNRQEANRTVDNWIQTFQNTKEQVGELAEDAGYTAKKAADTAASAISKASIFAFIGLVLGGVAEGVGGKLGEPHDVAISEDSDRI